nr:hypothetical protein Iba_chr07dCG7230 [Ipomoea batatas]
MHENGQPVTAPTLLLTLLNLLQTPPELASRLQMLQRRIPVAAGVSHQRGHRKSPLNRCPICHESLFSAVKLLQPKQREIYQVEQPLECGIVDTAQAWVSTWSRQIPLLLKSNTTAIFPLLVTPLDNRSESAAQTLRLLEFSSSLETVVAGRLPLDCRHCSATRRRPPMLEDYCSTVDAAQPLAGACSSLSTLLSWDSFSLCRPPEVDAGKLFPEVHSLSALLATSCFTGGKLE